MTSLRRSGLGARFLLLPVVLLAAAAGALIGGGDRLGAQPLRLADENSWIRIQNVGVEPATIDIDFFGLDGSLVAEDRCPTEGRCSALEPGFGWSFFQQEYGPLPAGYRGSAHVDVDQPFVSMLARDAFKGDIFEISGDSLRLGAGSSLQYAPIVQNTSTYVSRISVQNTSADRDGCFEIAYYPQGSLQAAAVDPPGPTDGCPNGGHLVRPNGTLLRDETNIPVPAGFDGAAVVRAKDTGSGVAASAQQPSLVVDTRNRTAAGLATYRGLDANELGNDVVLPLVDRSASEGQTSWTTRFRILSSNPNVPNEVKLLFQGVTVNGDRLEVENTVTVNGSLTCDQRLPAVGGCLPAGESLPEVFFGTVRLNAAEPIAVIAQRVSPDGALADYRGFSAEEASRQIVLPVLNKNFGPWGGFDGWNSWFRVLTFDGSTANVRVVYYSREFPGGLISQPVTVEGQRTFRQWESKDLPDGWVGSAIIVADRPVVVLANLESDIFDGDPVMLYNGVSLE